LFVCLFCLFVCLFVCFVCLFVCFFLRAIWGNIQFKDCGVGPTTVKANTKAQYQSQGLNISPYCSTLGTIHYNSNYHNSCMQAGSMIIAISYD